MIGRAWCDAVAVLSADAAGGSPDHAVGYAADLERRYAEVHRHYHTAAHVEAVLRDCAWLAGELALPARERAVLALAACAHDVVYSGRAGEDERASAQWARDALGDTPGGERVAQLVLATITHEAGDDLAAAAFLDADLAILAAPEPAYDAYAAAVRAEYADVTDEGWRAGRGAVLRGLLARDPIYRTPPARERWEVAARANLTRELRRTDPPPSP